MDLRKLLYAGMFTAIMSIMAQIALPIPFSPVPVTLQVMAICLAGAILGSKTGFISILTYDLLGIIGVPVFSNFHGGLSSLLSPGGGYIIAFPIAAYIIGLILERNEINVFKVVIAMSAGLIVIYLFGMIQMKILLGLTWAKAFMMAVGVFLPLDLIKIVLSSFIVIPVRKAIGNVSHLRV